MAGFGITDEFFSYSYSLRCLDRCRALAILAEARANRGQDHRAEGTCAALLEKAKSAAILEKDEEPPADPSKLAPAIDAIIRAQVALGDIDAAIETIRSSPWSDKLDDTVIDLLNDFVKNADVAALNDSPSWSRPMLRSSRRARSCASERMPIPFSRLGLTKTAIPSPRRSTSRKSRSATRPLEPWHSTGCSAASNSTPASRAPRPPPAASTTPGFASIA